MKNRAITITVWAGISCLSLVALGVSLIQMSESEPERKQEGDEPGATRVEGARRRAEKRLRPLLEQQALSLGSEIFIRIFKESSELEVFLKARQTGSFQLLKSYRICAFSGGLGPKLAQGDRQAPEGFYSVGRPSMNPLSDFHLAFNLGYPNAYDRAHGRSGDFLMVHGDCVSTGCYAMTDPGIEDIYTLADAALAGGQEEFQVHCFPFRMSGERLAEAAESHPTWRRFWEDLKRGYDLFETDMIPPEAGVEGMRYTFRSGRCR